MLTSPSAPVRVSRASVRSVPSTKGDAAGAVPVGPPVRHERPAVLDPLALDGVGRVVRRLEASPVGGVEGLDAEGDRLQTYATCRTHHTLTGSRRRAEGLRRARSAP